MCSTRLQNVAWVPLNTYFTLHFITTSVQDLISVNNFAWSPFFFFFLLFLFLSFFLLESAVIYPKIIFSWDRIDWIGWCTDRNFSRVQHLISTSFSPNWASSFGVLCCIPQVEASQSKTWAFKFLTSLLKSARKIASLAFHASAESGRRTNFTMWHTFMEDDSARVSIIEIHNMSYWGFN